MYNNREYISQHLSSGTSNQVFTSKGILQCVTVNATSGSAFSIYDGIASTAQPIGILKASIVEGTYWFNAVVSSGLYVTFGGSGDYTVTWAKG